MRSPPPAPKCHPPIAEAKTADELREIARGVLAARKRSAARQLQAQRRDRKMRECHAEWRDKVLPHWEKHQKYNNGRGNSSNSKVVRRLCAAGIPTSLRGKVWPLLMGNALQITPELMEIFHGHAQAFKHDESTRREAARRENEARQRRRTRRPEFEVAAEAAAAAAAEVEEAPAPAAEVADVEEEAAETEEAELAEDAAKAFAAIGDKEGGAAASGAAASFSAPDKADDKHSDSGSSDGKPRPGNGNPQHLGKSRSLHLIECDLPRTYPSLAFFREDQPIGRDLRKLLETYAFYRPDVGYIQGMSYIAGVLLLNCDLPTAFQCFANLLSTHFYFDFFRLEKSKIDIHLRVYESLLKERLPRLARHFKAEDVQPDMYMIDWLMTLYSRSMPMNVAARVWDLYLCEGELSLFRVAIGLLKMHESALLCMEFGDMMKFLHNIPPDLDEDELFTAHVAKVEFSKKKFKAIQDQVMAAAEAGQ
jgi:hypothetical protein